MSIIYVLAVVRSAQVSCRYRFSCAIRITNQTIENSLTTNVRVYTVVNYSRGQTVSRSLSICLILKLSEHQCQETLKLSLYERAYRKLYHLQLTTNKFCFLNSNKNKQKILLNHIKIVHTLRSRMYVHYSTQSGNCGTFTFANGENSIASPGTTGNPAINHLRIVHRNRYVSLSFFHSLPVLTSVQLPQKR